MVKGKNGGVEGLFGGEHPRFEHVLSGPGGGLWQGVAEACVVTTHRTPSVSGRRVGGLLRVRLGATGDAKLGNWCGRIEAHTASYGDDIHYIVGPANTPRLYFLATQCLLPGTWASIHGSIC